MNRLPTLLAALGLAVSASAQTTNTFPADGNVGIGTMSPTWKLQVAGNIYGSSAVLDTDSGWGYGARLQLYGQSGPIALQIKREVNNPANWFWYLPSDNSDIALNNGADRLYVSSGGNVGIGTTNPVDPLHIYKPGQAGLRLQTPGRQWALLTNEGWGASGFSVYDIDADSARLHINVQGNVGIGTINPQTKLAVNGTITAREVVVTTAITASEVKIKTSGWSDYVFADSYDLKPLSEVERQIKTDKHLPGIPSAQEVAEKGINVGDMQAKLLAKIEELTLHAIQQERRIERLEQENHNLRK